MDRLVWVCVGGAVGSGARYLVAGWVMRWANSTFPYGTLAVNLIGSFLLGALMHIGLSSDVLSPNARLALTTGLLGGFTTYSTFSYESMQLLREGAWLHAGLNLGGTVAACLLASAAGYATGRWVIGA